jgi:Fe(3+) dicitrate transport protein
MVNGRLVYAGIYPTQTFNEAETDALAIFVSDELEYKNWKFTVGLRYEDIEGSFTDKLTGSRGDNDQDVLLPGVGVFYQWTDNLGFLFGVNKGFSPAGPGAGSDIDPEESINYEYGFRYQQGGFTADVIGFFSDYDNLLGRCRVSDVGCTAGEEFNGGAVEIAGVEITSGYTAGLPHGLLMPVNLVYTYTETAFQSSFISGFSQWNPEVFNGSLGSVVKGDELPYTPEHQLQLQLGLRSLDWGIDLAIKHISEMREVPGRGGFESGTSTKAYTTFDLAASYQFNDEWQIKLVGENITDKQVIVSRRPFGARPNQPRLIKLNINYRF